LGKEGCVLQVTGKGKTNGGKDPGDPEDLKPNVDFRLLGRPFSRREWLKKPKGNTGRGKRGKT